MLGRGRGGEGTAGERFRLTSIADALATVVPWYQPSGRQGSLESLQVRIHAPWA